MNLFELSTQLFICDIFIRFVNLGYRVQYYRTIIGKIMMRLLLDQSKIKRLVKINLITNLQF